MLCSPCRWDVWKACIVSHLNFWPKFKKRVLLNYLGEIKGTITMVEVVE